MQPNPIQTIQHFLSARWRAQRLRGNALLRFQDRRAHQIIAYALAHSPFYRAHWAGHDLRDWRNLPIVTKRDLVEQFDTLNTEGIHHAAALQAARQAEAGQPGPPLRGRTGAPLIAGLSSGTSGERGLFLVGPGEQAAWTGILLARTLHRLSWSGVRVAFFLRANSQLYESVRGRLIRFRYFDLQTPLTRSVAALNQFQPDILVGPPSLLEQLATARCVGQLQIRPTRLIAVAEVLEPQDRLWLTAAFEAPVHQIYQATEGLLAATCAHGSLHLLEDVVAIQIEPLSNDSTRGVPILTDLWRTTQPMIRYRLNDLIRLDPRSCACGSAFRIVREVEGRTDDICHLLTPASDLCPLFPADLRAAIRGTTPHICDYRIEQDHPGQLRIWLALTPGLSFEAVAANVVHSIEGLATQLGASTPRIELLPGIPPLPVATKRRRVICHTTHQTTWLA